MTILHPWIESPATNFYAAPDGEKPFEKFRYGLKIPFGAGLMLGLVYHASRNIDINNARTTGKMLYTAFPVMGLGFFYCGGTFIAGNLRKKDDELNHMIGVLTAAPLVRKFLSFHGTFVAVTYAAIIVALLKHTAMENKNMPEEDLSQIRGAGTIDWYIWSQSKPAGVGYLTYDLFK